MNRLSKYNCILCSYKTVVVVYYKTVYYGIINGNGNENISNAPPTVDRRRIT